MTIDPAQIPVVIPAGGLGMRLREETDRVPKPMVEIGGFPIMWHIMKVFASHGHRRFIVCLGYKGWVIKDWFLNYHQRLADITVNLASNEPAKVLTGGRHEDWEVTCAETGLTAGTVGRLCSVQRYIDAPYFMYAYGDSIGDVDVTAVRAKHEQSNDMLTVTGIRPLNRYGVLTSTEDGLVTDFAEKPEVTEGHANGGFMAMQTEILDRLASHHPGDFFEDVMMPQLVRDGRVGLYSHEGFWMGMDTMRDVVALEDLWQSGKAPWKTWSDD